MHVIVKDCWICIEGCLLPSENVGRLHRNDIVLKEIEEPVSSEVADAKPEQRKSDERMWDGVECSLDVPCSDEERLGSLCRVFYVVQQTEDCCPCAHASSICVLMWVKQRKFFPDTIRTLDDNGCEELAGDFVQAKRS